MLLVRCADQLGMTHMEMCLGGGIRGVGSRHCAVTGSWRHDTTTRAGPFICLAALMT